MNIKKNIALLLSVLLFCNGSILSAQASRSIPFDFILDTDVEAIESPTYGADWQQQKGADHTMGETTPDEASPSVATQSISTRVSYQFETSNITMYQGQKVYVRSNMPDRGYNGSEQIVCPVGGTKIVSNQLEEDGMVMLELHGITPGYYEIQFVYRNENLPGYPQGKSNILRITVKKPEGFIQKLYPLNNLSLIVGDSDRLTTNFFEGIEERLGFLPNRDHVDWISSRPDILMVGNTKKDKGVITAVAAGSAVITARSKCGNYQVTKTMVVNAPYTPVNSVTLTQPSSDLQVNQTMSLQASVLPSNATEPGISWSSTNDNIATVNAQGVVTANAVGSVVITAESQSNQQAKKSVTLNITPIPVASVRITTPVSTVLSVGETLCLNHTLLPNNATNTSIKWESEHPSIARVDENSGAVTAISEGSTKIKVTSIFDLNKFDTIELQITRPYIPLDSISILPPSTTSLFVGETLQLESRVLPENTDDSSVIWRSNNPSVATIDSDSGSITAVRSGIAEIVLESRSDPSKRAMINISVSVELTSITINTYATINPGETNTLNIMTEPANVSENFSWHSEQAGIAIIDQNGQITGISPGNTRIYAEAPNGVRSNYCFVTVRRVQQHIPLENLSFDSDSRTISVGQSISLIPIYVPENATNQNISQWISTDSDVADFIDGVVTAKAEGYTFAIAKSEENGLIAFCQIEVTQDVQEIQPESIHLLETGILQMNIGEQVIPQYEVLPVNATNKNVVLYSMSPSVISVNTEGRLVGLSEGVALIKIQTVVGNKSVYIQVNVSGQTQLPQQPEGNLSLIATALSDREASVANGAAKAIDGVQSTRWLTSPGTRSCFLELNFTQEVQFNTVHIEQFSAKINEFDIEVYFNGQWEPVYHGNGISGNKSLDAVFNTITASKLRFHIQSTYASQPSILEFEVYKN